MILTYFSFDAEGRAYYVVAGDDGETERREVEFGKGLTMEFDLSRRYCIGWHEIGTKEDHVCPDGAEVEKKYEQCKKCMQRTGFNPAFYHSDNVSEKQVEYNRQPHGVYLAYFDEKNVKVGIFHERRERQRLLEQGARAAMILDKFGSANVARQYEAKISDMEGFIESLQIAKKLEILNEGGYDFARAEARLLSEKARIERELGVEFSGSEVVSLDEFYGDVGGLRDVVDMGARGVISGKVVACVGSILVVENEGELLGLSIKKVLGYKARISDEIEAVELPERQASLF